MSKNENTKFHSPDSAEMLVWIEHMYSLGPRRPGTKPDLACEDYLEGMLREAGLSDVRKEPIPIRVWEADSYCLSISCPPAAFDEVPAFCIPYTAFTPPEGVQGRLVYVPDNSLANSLSGSWKGKIVVADIEFPKLDPN